VNRTATSNTVNTIVQQVGSFTLTADNVKFVAPGGQVVYAHTLTNTGNGSDTFTLNSAQNVTGTPASDNFDLTGFAIYADLDGNGVADNAINLATTTVTLARNGVFKFVVVGSAPGTAVAADSATTTVTVTNSAPNTAITSIFNTDKATVTANAVITVTKSASVITGPIGTEVQYTLTYTNTGNNTATNVVITDAIPRELTPLLSGMKYKLNSGIWSAGGALTDAADGLEYSGGIDFNLTGTPGANETANIMIASVAPNVSGTIKFTVRVDDSSVDGNPVAAPGILTNTAGFAYNNGSTAITNQLTNSVNFTVLQTSAVAANDSSTGNAADGSNGIDGITPLTTGDYVLLVASACQGTVYVFNNYIWNNGNGVDKFNIE
jgi:uncharacterized repeat protein (TIGR01451 family)